MKQQKVCVLTDKDGHVLNKSQQHVWILWGLGMQ
jgi:hypothetical protein